MYRGGEAQRMDARFCKASFSCNASRPNCGQRAFISFASANLLIPSVGINARLGVCIDCGASFKSRLASRGSKAALAAGDLNSALSAVP